MKCLNFFKRKFVGKLDFRDKLSFTNDLSDILIFQKEKKSENFFSLMTTELLFDIYTFRLLFKFFSIFPIPLSITRLFYRRVSHWCVTSDQGGKTGDIRIEPISNISLRSVKAVNADRKAEDSAATKVRHLAKPSGAKRCENEQLHVPETRRLSALNGIKFNLD